jgi:hypothetical protein
MLVGEWGWVGRGVAM